MGDNDPSTSRALGELTGTVKSLCSTVDNLRREVHESHTDIQSRLRVLEADKQRRDGGTAKASMWRGVILTMFGGSVGAAIIKALESWRG